MKRTLLVLLLGALLSLGAAFGQTLIIAQGTDPTTLDAPLATDSPSATVITHIMEPLFEFTPEGTIEPLLVESYEFADDGLTLTLSLRQGVSFHDGTPFDAEAVKFNLDRYVVGDEALPFAFLLRGRVSEVTVVDDHTVELTLDEPFAPLLSHLSHSSIAMQSPTALQELGEDYAENPVGTGPFSFDSWARGERIDLVRNDDYWGEQPGVEAVRFLAVPEGTTRMALVETGEAHVAVRVPPAVIDRLEANPDVTIDHTDSVRTIYIYFNHTMEPFTDANVRQAINHAINKDDLVDFILGGMGRVSDAAISPNVFGYSPIGVYDYDPERARELLAEAGFENGFDMVLHCPSGRYMQDIQACEAIQPMLAAVGINAEIETLEWGAYLDLTNLPQEENPVQMAMLGWGTVTGDADYGLYALFHTAEHVPAGSNRSFYSNPELDALLEEARTETEPAAREEIYREALELIFEDAVWLFLHAETQVTAIRNNVEGFIVHPTERYLATRASLTD